jgi:hypothetical protein
LARFTPARDGTWTAALTGPQRPADEHATVCATDAFNAIAVPITEYVLMPILTKTLFRFLYR